MATPTPDAVINATSKPHQPVSDLPSPASTFGQKKVVPYKFQCNSYIHTCNYITTPTRGNTQNT